MRASLISMIAVLVLTACICVFSVMFIKDVCGRMEDMHDEVMDLAESGRVKEAHDVLQQMAQVWKKHQEATSVLVAHESIHKITELLIEAEACLKAGDIDDFSQSMALLREALVHMQDDERFHLSNILQVC